MRRSERQAKKSAEQKEAPDLSTEPAKTPVEAKEAVQGTSPGNEEELPSPSANMEMAAAVPSLTPPPAAGASDTILGNAISSSPNVGQTRLDIKVGPSIEEIMQGARPTRKRSAPVKYTRTEPTASMEPPEKESMPTRVKKDSTWSEEHLMQNSNSRLGKVDLLQLFVSDRGYDGFSEEQWEELRSSLPNHVLLPSENGAAPKIDPQFLRYDMDFRNGLRCFAEDLRAGRYDPEWIRQADEAMQARARGEFDSYKESTYEEFWGQKQEPPHTSAKGKGRK